MRGADSILLQLIHVQELEEHLSKLKIQIFCLGIEWNGMNPPLLRCGTKNAILFYFVKRAGGLLKPETHLPYLSYVRSLVLVPYRRIQQLCRLSLSQDKLAAFIFVSRQKVDSSIICRS
jgi:hypothetical protein